MSVPRDLPSLLDALDPEATQVGRHLWLMALLDWVRGDRQSVETSISRVQLFLDIVEERPVLRERVQAWWQALLGTIDGTTLLADHGFAQRPAFLSEFFSRLLRKILPATPQTRDASELFSLLFPHAFDAEWLALLDEATAQRLARLLALPTGATPTPWQQTLEEAITYCVSQIRAIGFAPELRLRMSAAAHEERPFHALVADFEAVCRALHQSPRDEAALATAVQHFKERLDACRHAAASVYAHLDEHGISVDMVFRLRQLRARALRVRELLDCLLTTTPAFSAAQLLGRLVLVGQQSRSLRALIASNSSLLAAKVTDRSAETGEHYITRNRAEYRDMLQRAAGGGAVIAGTTFLKFLIGLLGFTAFWGGFWAGVNYAASFVLIHLLHWTVATKQPAMTAPAMADKLLNIDRDDGLQGFVDEVTHLTRSQVAGIIGNLALAAPVVLAVQGLCWLAFGMPLVGEKDAQYVLHSLGLFGPSLLFAAFTGTLLFASSLIAGWVENWFVFHRLDSAIAWNPRIVGLLGRARAQRWSQWWRINISGLTANTSLGLMLGLVPALFGFFGLGLEVRHVTLATGQLAAAVGALGVGVMGTWAFWSCVLCIAGIGVLNVGVSFFCAFKVALRSRGVRLADRKRVYAAIRQRLRREPLSFLIPPR
ncbi:MAG TPA: site-specific recombinase [Roseateles sp.]